MSIYFSRTLWAAVCGLLHAALASCCAATSNDVMTLIKWKLECSTNVVNLHCDSNATNIAGYQAIASYIRQSLASVDDKTILLIDQPGAEQCREIQLLVSQVYAACAEPLAQVCFVEPRSGVTDIFHATTVSWKSPFDDPRNPEAARYYLDGKAIGNGPAAFDKIMDILHRIRPKTVIFVGSRFDRSRGYADEELPFEAENRRLNSMLKKDGILRLEPQYLIFLAKPQQPAQRL